MTEQQCEAKIAKLKVDYSNPNFHKTCGSPYMAPLFPTTDSANQPTSSAEPRVCIDQFEFPNIPCRYPIVWVRAAEAATICEAMGKRLCNAHEWEGACTGQMQPPDYDFTSHGKDAAQTVEVRRLKHNQALTPKWAYGPRYQKGRCAANSRKSAKCQGGGWSCGSNTYPVGAFPDCKSPYEVYDQHGNVAEHMNLPLQKDQILSSPPYQYGFTEMKGSWFIFDTYRAHPDHCRWRAPYWHGTRVNDPQSHRNYHLGFRCCKTLTSQN